MKKTLALILSLVLVLNLIPFGAAATVDTAEPEGMVSEITENLAEPAEDLSGDYEDGNDTDGLLRGDEPAPVSFEYDGDRLAFITESGDETDLLSIGAGEEAIINGTLRIYWRLNSGAVYDELYFNALVSDPDTWLDEFHAAASVWQETDENGVYSVFEFRLNKEYCGSAIAVVPIRYDDGTTTSVQYYLGVPAADKFLNEWTEGDYTYSVYDDEATINKYYGTQSNVVIPDHLGGYPVTRLEGHSFREQANITEVTLPDTLRAIGSGAFSDCTGLVSLTIPDSVHHIEKSGFWGCTGLEEVYVGAGMEIVDFDSFPQCTNLRAINVSTDNPNIKSVDGIVYSKDGTKCILCPQGKTGSVAIADAVSEIYIYAFYQCEKLTSAVIPEGVTVIRESAFSGCISLTTVTMPDSVTSIAYAAFDNCSALADIYYGGSRSQWKQIAMGSSNESLKDAAVHYAVADPDYSYTVDNGQITITQYNGAGTEVVIPDTIDGYPVTAIAENAFIENTEITKVIIPESVTEIGGFAFSYCSALREAVLPTGITKIENGLFMDCKELSSIAIPNGVTEIGERAFEGAGLTEVVIPDTVTDIGYFAFDGCANLQSVTIPGSVRRMMTSAFNDCGLREAILLYGITEIPAWTFTGCENLVTVVIPTSVTKIEYNSFWGCTSLTEIVIPKSVTFIGNSAFYKCSSITDVYYYGGTEDMWNAITIEADNESLTSAARHYEIPVTETTIPDDTFCAYVSENIDSDGDKVLNEEEISAVTSLDLSNQQISSVQGLEYFTDLQSLTCTDNELESLDVRWNTALEELDCSGNSLTELDVSENTALAELDCSNNKLTSLTLCQDAAPQNTEPQSAAADTMLFRAGARTLARNASKGTTALRDGAGVQTDAGLYRLICNGNALTELDISGNETLLRIVSEGQVSEGEGYKEYSGPADGYLLRVDIGTVILTEPPIPSGVPISAENFPDANFRSVVSERFDIDQNGYLDDTETDPVTGLDVAYREIASLQGIGFFTKLEFLDCSGNQLTDLYLSGNPALTELRCGNNSITELNISGNEALVKVICTTNQLATLDLSGNPALSELECGDNRLKTLDVSHNPALHYVACAQNQISVLDISECELLMNIATQGTRSQFDGIKQFFLPGTGSLQTDETTQILPVEADFSFTTENGTVTITGYIGKGTEVVIPDAIDGNPVTMIAANAFKDRADITSVTIPESVTKIGPKAFYYCTSLATIYFNAEEVENLSSTSEAFRCAGMSSSTGLTVIFGETVRRIPAYLFHPYTEETDTEEVEDGFGPTPQLRSIGAKTASARDGLATVSIPVSVTSIGTYAFHEIPGLTDVYYDGTRSEWNEISIERCNESLLDAAIHCSDDYLREYTYVIENGEITITGYSGTASELVIPAEIDGYPVTAIGESAFSYNNELLSVIIPDSVTTLGRGAFVFCENLESVTIGNGVTCINEWTFENCGYLKSITLSSGVTRIEEGAFHSTGLKTISIPGSVTYIGNRVFEYCSSLTDIYYDGTMAEWNMISIGYDNTGLYNATIHYIEASEERNYTYYIENDQVTITGYYGTQTDLVIPEVIAGCPVTCIGEQTFCGNGRIVNVTIPSSVSKICGYAFNECSSLKEVTIPDSVQSIGGYAFANCTSLETINFNASVTDLGYIYGSAFYHSGTLENDGLKLILGDTVQKVPGGIFNNSNIREVLLPASVTSIGDYAFVECTCLTSVAIPESVTSIGDAAFNYCTSLNNVLIPNSVTSIGKSAFFNCRALSSVTIPNSVTTIGGYAFSWCTGLEEVYYNSPITEDIIYFEEEASAYVPANVFRNAGTESANGMKVVIGDSVTRIPAYVFNDSGLTEITIPDTVTSIGTEAFKGCINLNEITIPDTVTSIGTEAFKGCINLNEITIPESITSIGRDAFCDCTGLTEVNYYASSASVPPGSGIFRGAGSAGTGITAVFGDTVRRIPAYLFYECTGLKEVTIPKGLLSLEDHAFYGCTGLSVIYYNASAVLDLTTGSNVFGSAGTAAADGMKVIFGSDVRRIPSFLFYSCSALEEAVISEGVKSIGEGAFFSCSALKNVILSANVTEIEKHAFGDCSGLVSATIENRTASIDDNAFTGASSLLQICGIECSTAARFARENSMAFRSIGTADHVLNESEEATIVTAPTCEENGQGTKICTICGQAVETIIPALEHDWGTPVYTWAEDNGSVVARSVCSHDPEHIEEETVETTSQKTKDPTCEEKGETTFTAVFTKSAFTTQEKTVQNIDALGHAWNATNYSWADDFSTCFAVRTCQRNAAHIELEIAQSTSATTSPATCDSNGVTTYTAVFENEAFQTQKKEVAIPALGHKLNAHEAKAATCTEAGSSAYWSCSVCGKYYSDADGRTEIQENSWIIAAKGHTLTAHAAKAATCTEAGNSAYWSCTECGKYFSDAEGRTEIQENSWVIAAKGHTLTPHAAKAATCTEAGNSAYWSCSECGKYFSDAEGRTEIAADSWVIAATGHKYEEIVWTWTEDYSSATVKITCSNDEGHTQTAAATVTSTATPATCETDGKTVYTATAVIDGVTYTDSKTVTIDALSHLWGAVNYFWADDNSTVMAIRTCSRNSTHIDFEVAETTSAVTRQPGCEDRGETTYTAVFENQAFGTRTKTVDNIEPAGHKWGAPTWKWSEDFSEATVTCVCSKDSAHTYTDTATVTSVRVEPTPNTDGSITYTAAAKDPDGKAVTDKKVTVLPATGYTYADPEYTWTDVKDESGTVTGYKVKAVKACNEDESRSIVETVEAVYSVKTAATCETAGEGVWTAAFENTAFTAQTKTEPIPARGHSLTSHEAKAATCTEAGSSAYWSCSGCGKYFSDAEGKTEISPDSWVIPAAGHKWGTPAWKWAEDFSGATVTYMCENDSTHPYTDTAVVTSVRVEPQPEKDGSVTYTATAKDPDGKTVTDTRVVTLPATGYTYADPEYTWTEVKDESGTVTGYQVKAVKACNEDESRSIVETVAAVYSVKTPAKCETAGEGVWTATFENTAFTVQTKTETIPAAGHALAAHEARDATCTEDGSSAYWSCSGCGKFFSDAEGKTEITENSWIIPATGHKWGEPKWTWAEDYSSATATFFCENDETHTETVSATVTGPVNGVYTAAAKGPDGKEYTDTVNTVVPKPAFGSQSLVLSGVIGLKFYMDLPEIPGVDYNESYMTFTIGKGTTEYRDEFDPNDMNSGKTRYGFTCYVSSIQMADMIKAVFHYGDGKTISKEYSVEQYIKAVEKNASSYNAKTNALIRSIADYGHYAQIYLSDINPWTIGVEYSEMKTHYKQEFDYSTILSNVESKAFVKPTGSAGIEKATYKLHLDSETTVDVFLTVKTGVTLTASAVYNGKTYSAVKQDDGRYMVRIPNIPAHRLGDMITITGDAGGEFTVRVSALSYARSVLASTATNKAAKDGLSALYEYYAAVVAFRA